MVRSGGPVLAYNLVLFLSMVASGLGVHLLVRRVSDDRLAAFVAGALFAVGAHRWTRLAHRTLRSRCSCRSRCWALDRFWAAADGAGARWSSA